jgi:hypothetical protein
MVGSVIPGTHAAKSSNGKKNYEIQRRRRGNSAAITEASHISSTRHKRIALHDITRANIATTLIAHTFAIHRCGSNNISSIACVVSFLNEMIATISVTGCQRWVSKAGYAC